MLYTMKELLDHALKNHYCVMAPSIRNEDCMRAAIEAAEEVHSPIILNINTGSLSGFKDPFFLPFQIQTARQAAYRAKVPVAINRDHAPSYEQCVIAVNAGMTSVMIDYSNLPFEENAAKTAEVVKMAHAAGVTVEAELGHVGIADLKSKALGSNDQLSAWSKLTDPEEVARFVELTDVDCLAISIGNKHGAYADGDKAYIDFDLLRKIRAKVPELPLVMHGGSGIGDDNLRQAFQEGICKINVGSELEKGAWKAIVDTYEQDGKVYKPYDVAREGYKARLVHHLKMLNSQDKAW